MRGQVEVRSAPSGRRRSWLGTVGRGLCGLIVIGVVACSASNPATTDTPSGSVSAQVASTSASPVPPQSEELQDQKLYEELRKLRLENERTDSIIGRAVAVSPFITALLGVVGVVATGPARFWWRSNSPCSEPK